MNKHKEESAINIKQILEEEKYHLSFQPWSLAKGG